MSLMFNTLLKEAELPLADVRLLRHKTDLAEKGRTPYELWRDNRPLFDWFQQTHKLIFRERLRATFWASFVGTPDDETLFVGCYRVKYRGLLKKDTPHPHKDGIQKVGSCDVYDLTLLPQFKEFDGKLSIDWGPGTRSWVQRADNQNKPIVELRKEFKEPEFPGLLHFIEPLSRLDKLPKSWSVVLQSSRGVYLLTCPRTKEQYVGAAYGSDNFWGRWQSYVKTGHGGNIALKSRDPSDYQVSILEVAGSAATTDDVLRMEVQWKSKLQSRQMGLNKN